MIPQLALAFQESMIVIATRFIPLLPLSIVSTMVYVGKQPVVLEEYCAEYWLKELQKSMDRYTGSPDNTVENSVKHYTLNQCTDNFVLHVYKKKLTFVL